MSAHCLRGTVLRRLQLGCVGAGCVLAVGVLAASPAEAVEVPGAAGASWLRPVAALMSDTHEPRVSGSWDRSSPDSVPGSSVSSSASSFVPSFTDSGAWASYLPASGCDPSSYSEPSFSPGSPQSPYPSCDPASYQVEVVQAVTDLRDVLAYGLGLILLTTAATMVLTARKV